VHTPEGGEGSKKTTQNNIHLKRNPCKKGKDSRKGATSHKVPAGQEGESPEWVFPEKKMQRPSAVKMKQKERKGGKRQLDDLQSSKNRTRKV